MRMQGRWGSAVGLVMAMLVTAGWPTSYRSAAEADASASWTRTGWGGGGFFYSVAFHPTQDGVIYMGGDVLGCYKSLDHGRTWRIINDGLAGYGVFALAVDPSSPQTVYASTDGGLCKSIDGGEHWKLLPRTGRKDLRITGEKNKSYRNVAVDPTDSRIVYAASPLGKIYKSTDGGQTWNLIYTKTFEKEAGDFLRAQFGKMNTGTFGGFWSKIALPQNAAPADCVGIGFTVKGNGVEPGKAYLKLKTTDNQIYRSKNLRSLFTHDQWEDIVLSADDFAPDPTYARKHPKQAAKMPATPDWSKIKRVDLACGDLKREASVAWFKRFFFAIKGAAGQPPTLETVLDLAGKKALAGYGNVRTGPQKAGTIYVVAVSPDDPACVVAASRDAGVILSEDAGQTWRELATPKKAASVAFAGPDAKTLYASFYSDGVYKSTDRGDTWTRITPPDASDKTMFLDVAANPANAQQVHVIARQGWNGSVFRSHDGGQTWHKTTRLTADLKANPTLPQAAASGTVGISNPRNLAINPNNPQEMFIAANWRPCISADGGQTWSESSRGADISVITDIQFSKDGQRTYVTAMDQGTLVSIDHGESWRPLWPMKDDPKISGHNWRVAVNEVNGKDRLISTCSPWWNRYPNRVIRSDDGGESHQVVTEGLPDYVPTSNTMWGRSYARALAVDPHNPDVVYLGMDGAPTAGKTGGGLFKSTDGGRSWKQLPQQPDKRRVFFGLAVDPTDSNRIYWGVGGSGNGLYRSEDAGRTWKRVFKRDGWTFNVLVTDDGTVYCPGVNLWRSTDHGKTWKKLTSFKNTPALVGLEVDPTEPDTIWISAVSWSGVAGSVHKTTNGGKTWTPITGDLPYHKPMVLRFNPTTRELWAGGTGLYKIQQ